MAEDTVVEVPLGGIVKVAMVIPSINKEFKVTVTASVVCRVMEALYIFLELG
jgi:hypothetical protein